MSYYYNGVNISDLVQSGSTAVPDYAGFPESNLPQYTSGLDKPYNFSYQLVTTPGIIDVSNYSTAYNLSYTSGNATIPTAIPNSSGYLFKHIAGYCFGGGGGGGGGGGTGSDVPGAETKSGGKGGAGGAGGYAAILSTPLQGSSNVFITVGGGGAGGDGGPGNPGNSINDAKGSPGSDGTTADASYIQIPDINTIIAAANGGGGGNSGGGGTSKDTGSDGSTGNSGYGSINGTGNTSVQPGYPNVPSSYQAGGGGGPGGEGTPYKLFSPNDVRTGGKGGTGYGGYVQIYLTYQA